jgi:tetratricopeptide (TPR) repeat protein/CHAT domain-containing protein
MKTRGRLLATTAVTILMTTVFAEPVVAPSAPSAAQIASIKTYLPELQRLQQKADWAGLEQLARQAMTELEAQLGPESVDVASASDWLAVALVGERRFAEAEPLFRRTLAIFEKAFGPEHTNTAATLRALGGSIANQGRYGEAEPLLRRSLVMFEKAGGEQSAQTAGNLLDLANVLRLQDRYAEAEPLFQRALASNEKAGRERDVAASLGGLANLLTAQARYADAEPLLRHALAIDEKAFGPEHPTTAVILNALAESLTDQGRFAEAEPFYRRALAIFEKALGEQYPETTSALIDLAYSLQRQGRYDEAEPLLQRALASNEKAGREGGVAGGLNNIALLLRLQGRYSEAEPLLRRALAIDEKAFGPEHSRTAISLSYLAGSLVEQGRYAEAEPLYRRALAIHEKAFGPEHPRTAIGLNNLAASLKDEGRYAEAEPLYRRALAIRERASAPEDPDIAVELGNLAGLLREQGRYAEAEPLYRRALAIDEKALGPEHPQTAVTIDHLAQLLRVEGRYEQAEPLLRRALAINEKALGPQHPHTAASLNDLALVLQSQGRYAEAELLFRRAVAIDEKALGPQHPETATAREGLGRNDEYQGKFSDASSNYRLACSARSSVGRARDLSGDAALIAQEKANTCSTQLSLSLWGWFAQGGGTATSDHPDALKQEAFATSQQAVSSAAGDALAHSAALGVARSAAVGSQAHDYEAALLERDTLDQQFATAAGETTQEAVEKRQALAKAHDEVVARIERLIAELKTRAPRYWDYRSPEAVSVSALQATTGPDATLLHDDEALIAFLVAPGQDKGLVFAVSKDRIAWAQLGLTGDELKARVIKLRAQIDPEGYRLPGTVVGHTAGPDAASNPGAFDRQAAYELYRVLLGDASIDAVIKEKPVLLFVPSGPLTSLPPGLLVTAPPAGGAAGDADPAALRATPWLLRSKAVALLPAVSSLRTLRQILPAARISTPDPLLVFADPDFSRPGRAPETRVASAPARGFSTYFRDGVPLAEALDYVPSLPGTLIEGEALERALQGRPGSLLTGRNASKAQLMARNADGRLAKVRVLEFATHGLVAGDASDLAEPALVLAADATPADELLLASEAATLRLNADWVLLSACNTASPDAPEAQGLSGLSRAFFYAGAKSLLVSHWRVRDDVAPVLIPAMLLAERQHPELGHAQALRQASLAILDNRGLNATSPAAWAPFTLIGEAKP